ncbi:MAG: hypothetical protein EOM91_06680 [Sphingobacteriia bacterium]|nr:hypothetical protein [Sphingobacteriia bacterium]NCC38139.1 hypothetical protein [Gammaproteobacteria bacterium]
MSKHTVPRSILILILGLGTAAMAADNAFVPDAEPPVPASVRPGAPWQEAPTQLPPWPSEADLVELVLDGPRSSLRYFIDGRHLRVGSDGVVRYTLVARAPGGASNVSVEGIRCTPRGAYKLFAIGLEGRFETLADSEWQPISELSSERYRDALWRFHLCVPLAFRPRPETDMIRSLSGHLAPRQNMGFQAD